MKHYETMQEVLSERIANTLDLLHFIGPFRASGSAAEHFNRETGVAI